jgi:hypothetical protein
MENWVIVRDKEATEFARCFVPVSSSCNAVIDVAR